jgi:AbrB family looped-hinge helix DNA binding protein
MATETAKLTRKYQATIPAGVRKTLNLRAGEVVAFDVEGGEVRLRKATPLDVGFAQGLTGTLGEWATREDEEAYRDL